MRSWDIRHPLLDMNDPTAVKRWLAVLRVATGGVFVYMASE